MSPDPYDGSADFKALCLREAIRTWGAVISAIDAAELAMRRIGGTPAYTSDTQALPVARQQAEAMLHRLRNLPRCDCGSDFLAGVWELVRLGTSLPAGHFLVQSRRDVYVVHGLDFNPDVLPQPESVTTVGGRVLTESDIYDLAAEAEAGYDLDKLKPRTRGGKA